MSEIIINNKAKTLTKKLQDKLSPDDALQLLLDGNERFRERKKATRDLVSQVEKTASGQYPFAAVLSCIDSRIPAEVVFDQGIGDIFSVRIAGNFINDDILGSLEFSCKLAGAKLIVILGHTSCGAVKGACDHAQLGNLTQMLKKIEPAVEMTKTHEGVDRSSKNLEFVNRVSRNNVKIAIEQLKSRSPVLSEMIENGEIKLVGALYYVKSGKVELI